jgi:hypothetical protein
MRILLLSAPASIGALWCVLILIVCFFFVHLFRLAKFGWLYQNKPQKNQATPPEEKAKPKKDASTPTAQEPVYYIVERKKRTKSSYSEPKQIRFK